MHVLLLILSNQIFMSRNLFLPSRSVVQTFSLKFKGKVLRVALGHLGRRQL